MRRFSILLLAAALATGCALKGPMSTGLKPRGVMAAGIVGSNTSRLAGTVTLPAGLLSNNGAGIISDNGGGLTGKAKYDLLAGAPASAPVPGAGLVVAVLDGAGKPVPGPDGKPLTARTDARGAYAFAQAPAGNNVVLAIGLPGGDVARAIAPAGRAAGRAVDVDLASSVATGFILQAHVRGTRNPQATLDKLPADAEAATRQATAAALAKAPDLAPSHLSDARVVAAVQALRAGDRALDAQLEAVRRLFVTAGVADQGAGRPALEIDLDNLDNIAMSPAGELVFPTDLWDRLWRLDADGRVQTLVGRGGREEAIEGVAAAQAGLDTILAFRYAPDGRLWLLERDRLSRLEADGRLHVLASGLADARAMVMRPDGTAWVFRNGPTPGVYSINSDNRPERLHDFTAAELGRDREIERAAWSPDGRLWLAGHVKDNVPDEVAGTFDERRWLAEVDPRTWTFRAIEIERDGVDGFALDPAGNVLYVEGGRALKLRRPDGAVSTVADALPKSFGLNLDGALVTPDGVVYVAPYGWELYEGVDGRLTKLAGQYDAQGDAADRVSFSSVVDVAVSKAGRIYMADDMYAAVYTQEPGGGAVKLLMKGCFEAADCPAEAGDLTRAGIGTFVNMGLDGQDVLHVLDVDDLAKPSPARLRTLGADGELAMRHRFDPAVVPEGMDVLPDGTAMLAVAEGGVKKLVALAPGADATTELCTLPPIPGPEVRTYRVAARSADAAWLATKGRLLRWTRAGGVATIAEDARLSGVGLTVDAQGRALAATEDAILRCDPATGALTPVVGKGSGVLAGTGTDDGVSEVWGLRFAPSGDLHVADTGHNQFKVVPKGRIIP